MNSKPLLNLVDRKIHEMERYSEITNRMLYEDIDGVGELLAERQSIRSEERRVGKECG